MKVKNMKICIWSILGQSKYSCIFKIQNANSLEIPTDSKFGSQATVRDRTQRSYLYGMSIGFQALSKVLVVTFKGLNGLGPRYLKDHFLLYCTTSHLKSASCALPDTEQVYNCLISGFLKNQRR